MKRGRPSKAAAQARAAYEAQRRFTLAAAALIEWPAHDALALALLHGAIGMIRVADADFDETARDRVSAVCAQLRGDQEPKLTDDNEAALRWYGAIS